MIKLTLAEYPQSTHCQFLTQRLSTNLGNVFIQELNLQMLLGRTFIKLKFSKPKIIWFLSKAKNIISKPVAMVYRDVGLSNHLKYVAILVSLLLFLFFPRIGLMASHRWLPVGFWVLASVVFALGAEVPPALGSTGIHCWSLIALAASCVEVIHELWVPSR